MDNVILAAVPARGPVGDAFISEKHGSFGDLPTGAVVATSSLRRRAQVLHKRPDLQLVDMRGNVETRLRKLREQNLDALILAEAGLLRLGKAEEITEILDPSWMLPAVGQGALGLECRADDERTRSILAQLNDPQTQACAFAERALLRGLGGGCQVPIGAFTSLQGENLVLQGAVLAPDGSRRVEGEISGDMDRAESLGQQLAEDLLKKGANELLGEV